MDLRFLEAVGRAVWGTGAGVGVDAGVGVGVEAGVEAGVEVGAEVGEDEGKGGVGLSDFEKCNRDENVGSVRQHFSPSPFPRYVQMTASE